MSQCIQIKFPLPKYNDMDYRKTLNVNVWEKWQEQPWKKVKLAIKIGFNRYIYYNITNVNIELCTKYACLYNNMEIYNLMIEKLETKFSNFIHPERYADCNNIWLDVMSAACKSCNLEIFKFVVKKLDILNHNEINNILYCACKGGNNEIINCVTDMGANDWSKGLLGACMGSNLEIVKMMLEKIKSSFSALPLATQDIIIATDIGNGLYGASKRGNLEIINLLVESGADNLNYGLQGACAGGHMQVIQFLIERGANDWNSGLKMACSKSHLDIINLMIKKGANAWNEALHNICWNFGKYNIPSYLDYYHNSVQMDIILMLIKNGANNFNYALKASKNSNSNEIKNLLNTMVEQSKTNKS